MSRPQLDLHGRLKIFQLYDGAEAVLIQWKPARQTYDVHILDALNAFSTYDIFNPRWVYWVVT